MRITRQFIAGIIIPSVLIPILLTILTYLGRGQISNILLVHWVPLIWGFWNVFYFAVLRDYLPRNKDIRLFLTGGILGLILVLIATYVYGIPAIIGVPNFIPLIFVPILYAIVWRFLVGPLNSILRND